MQKEVILTVGAPCSGKTTWALDYVSNNRDELNQKGFLHVNRDEIRNMLTGDLYCKGGYRFDKEGLVTKVVDQLVEEFNTSPKFNVLIKSDTNLNLGHLQQRVNGYLKKGYKIFFARFLDVPMGVLLERGKQRHINGGIAIPYNVMERMLAKVPEVETYIETLIKENKAHDIR